jgi:ABC-type multidrug transport system fused ATPase/permease subunit
VQSLGGENKRKSVWPALFTMARILPQASLGFTVGAVALVILTGAAPSIATISGGQLVGAIVRHNRGDVNRWLVVLGCTFVASQLMGPLLQLCSDALGRRLTGHLRARAMEAAGHPAGIGHLEDPATLDQVMLAQGFGTNQVTPRFVVISTFAIAAQYSTAVASGLILLAFHWWLPLLLVLASVVIMRTFRRQFFRDVQGITGEAETLRRSQYYRDLALMPGAVKETRIFGLGDWVVERFRSSWRGAMEDLWSERSDSWRTIAICGPVFFAIECGATLFIARAAIRGEISLDRAVVFLGALTGMQSLFNLSDYDLNLVWGAPTITAVTDLEARVRAPAAVVSGTGSADALPAREVRFENVSFAYPGREKVFDGLDLTITAGQSLAIVGDNGAGKTTLMKLLCRLYDPTGGRILVDGEPLTEIDPRQWQRRLSAIFQDFTKYQLTAADNVAFGNPDVPVAAEGLAHAAERAGATELVAGLAHGWDTVLSRQFKDGTDLSGGQWQRLALARALYAVDHGAGVLILDEPTASLDVRAEAELYDRFLDLTRGLTTLVISHRFSTVRRADRIVVIEHGRVIEDGSHDALLASGGHYATMFRLQAARFTDTEEPVDA